MPETTGRTDAADARARIVFAWMGWRVRMPAAWRPLRIDGGWDRGAVVLGDAERALLQIKWHRLRGRRVDGARWSARRQRQEGAGLEPDPRPPAPEGLSAVRASGAGARWLWTAWSEENRLALEAVVNATAPDRAVRIAKREVVGRLRVDPPGAPLRLAVYGVSVEAPPRFRPERWKLVVGDIAIRCTAPGERLLLRQIYPAGAALKRRTPAGWLAASPFAVPTRRVRELETEEADGAEAEAPAEAVPAGARAGRRAVKRIAWPLGRLRPWRSAGLAVEDPARDRLLVAEHDARREPDPDLVASALERMNWALAEGTGGEAGGDAA
jgi:hypothetical protein